MYAGLLSPKTTLDCMHSAEGPSKRNRLLDNGKEKVFVALYDYMKANTALKMPDKNKGELIFPLITLCSDYSTGVP